ncbi:MAG: tRNA pseudouridine(38-40) synthase TruA [Pelolinea sp.]|nr:tRNA pseudouridine(38-40) synthase TruA [Pelolinea sp.]
MALYQIKISYDGTDFYGYQRQLIKRTVQGEIENALGELGWMGETITSSGRTDTGVHADEQVAVFELMWPHTDEDLGRALNYYLPSDLSVISVKIAKDGFHPRYDAKSRKYRYQIYVNPSTEPLAERYHWRVWPEVDLELMNQAAGKICGTHNFSAFGNPYKKGGRTQRTIEKAEWSRIRENRIYFQIRANSFLYHMVRRITFILVCAGQHKVKLDTIIDSLEGVGNLPSGIAPAKGLFLEEIIY